MRDQISHLWYFDGTAVLAATDPDAFAESVKVLMGTGGPDLSVEPGRGMPPAGLLAAWREDVRGKVRQCESGTRWVEKAPLRARLRRWRAVRWAHDVPLLREAWRMVRWRLGPRLKHWILPTRCPYLWSDFEFASGDLSDAVWFCAVLRP